MTASQTAIFRAKDTGMNVAVQELIDKEAVRNRMRSCFLIQSFAPPHGA